MVNLRNYIAIIDNIVTSVFPDVNTASAEFETRNDIDRCPLCGIALNERGVCPKCGYKKP